MTSLVLIVEDDPVIAWDLETLVQEAGADARACWSVRDALPHLEENLAGAFLDIDVLDGKTFSVARRLKERHVPIAFISGSRSADLPPEFCESPFISKPFRAPDVVKTLKAMIA